MLCGDWNIAHQPIDLRNWRSNQKNSGFLPEERAWLTRVFDELGFVDVFRRVDPRPEQYTWWSNRGQAWAKNVGWRIDYQIATPGIAARARAASIYKAALLGPRAADRRLRLRAAAVSLSCIDPPAMLRLSNLTLARGAKRLLEGASLTVHPGHRSGWSAPNGCGKSSLFALLRGELLPDAGEVELPPAWTIAHVAQETPRGRDAGARLRAGRRRRAARDRARRSPPRRPRTTRPARDGEALAELHHRYEAIGGYAARARAATLLAGLGFREAQHARPVASFSGGWRMRLNLAQALMCRSDLLLLDEPTNHLDLDAVLWLEDWLGALSRHAAADHARPRFPRRRRDRHRPRRRAQAQDLRRQLLAFERERAQQLALQQATYEKQQRQIAHLQAFVDRFRAKATKAKQAQSRIKALERMERIAAAHVDSPFEFAFAPRRRAPRGSSCGSSTPRWATAGRAAVLAGTRLRAPRRRPHRPARPQRRRQVDAGEGARRDAARRGPASAHVAQDLRIGYFAQHQLEQLAPRSRRSGTCSASSPAAREQDLRDFLGGFDFRGDMATAPVARFSGGEKARLVLALIVRQQAATCCSSTSRPTTSTSRCARRWPRPCRITPARWSWSRTTATCCARPPTRCGSCRRQGRAVRRRPRRLPRLGAAASAARGAAAARPAPEGRSAPRRTGGRRSARKRRPGSAARRRASRSRAGRRRSRRSSPR